MLGRGNPNADLAASSGQDADYGWSSPDEATHRPFSRDPEEVLELASQHDLCVVGDALRHLQATGAERLFIPLIQVCLLPAWYPSAGRFEGRIWASCMLLFGWG